MPWISAMVPVKSAGGGVATKPAPGEGASAEKSAELTSVSTFSTAPAFWRCSAVVTDAAVAAVPSGALLVPHPRRSTTDASVGAVAAVPPAMNSVPPAPPGLRPAATWSTFGTGAPTAPLLPPWTTIVVLGPDGPERPPRSTRCPCRSESGTGPTCRSGDRAARRVVELDVLVDVRRAGRAAVQVGLGDDEAGAGGIRLRWLREDEWRGEQPPMSLRQAARESAVAGRGRPSNRRRGSVHRGATGDAERSSVGSPPATGVEGT